ncbi:hypothetical protein NEOLEDRAFT_1081901, partial [Neolentinus lepideus HHB14362 ss-1]
MSYCVIPPALRAQEATEARFKSAQLPFNQCQYLMVSGTQWEERFNHLFPTVKKSGSQNYPKALYWQRYWVLKESVSHGVWQRARFALRSKVNELWWLPLTETGKMWVSKVKPNMKALPRNGGGGGPLIALNP